MAVERADTLQSRAWSSDSLSAGVEHCTAMSGLHPIHDLSRADLLKRLQARYPKTFCSTLRYTQNVIYPAGDRSSAAQDRI